MKNGLKPIDGLVAFAYICCTLKTGVSMKTVLITGCSSGFGLETSRIFLDRDWRVIATMRQPHEDVLPASDRLLILPLDVADPASIRNAVEAAGPIDVLVNNAGIGLMNMLEGVSMAMAREVFETNTLGTFAMTQAVLPGFRAQGSGVIVNVTSSTTLRPLPMLSLYTASKAAVNAFSESVALELEPFNIRVRLVIPGRSPETSFAANARSTPQYGVPEAYTAVAERFFARMQQAPTAVTYAADVAEAVWRAATDPSCPMRLPAGADAVALGS
jgi:NAD(P)-dependent dehydrogenase (short-subunit alcohol dehydrogenase family)